MSSCRTANVVVLRSLNSVALVALVATASAACRPDTSLGVDDASSSPDVITVLRPDSASPGVDSSASPDVATAHDAAADVATGTDASVGTDASPPTDAGPATVQHHGGVALGFAGASGARPTISTAEAFFMDTTTSPLCHNRTEGACLVTVCSPSGSSTTTYVNAGTVHITAPGSTAVSLASLPLPGRSGLWSMDGLYWHPGQVVTISGDGAAVPAFSGSFTFPDTASVSAPVADVGTGRVAIDRSAGVDVRWTGGTGSVDVGVFQDFAGAPQLVTVWCVFDAAAGSGNVPASALSDFATRSGTTGIDTQFQVSSSGSQTVTAGEYAVTLSASQADLTVEADVR